MALAAKGSSISTDGCPSSAPAIRKVSSTNSVAALDSNKGQERLQLQSQANASGKQLFHNLLVRVVNDF
jgi:jasmonate ZIM domain-containing protein